MEYIKNRIAIVLFLSRIIISMKNFLPNVSANQFVI